jgi:TolB protein
LVPRRIVDSMDEPDEPIEPIEPRPPSRARMAIAVLVALAVTAAFLAGSIGALFRGRVAPEPAPTTHPGRLAVVDAAGALSTMDERGGSVVSYRATGAELQFPAWSPDGSRIAAVGSAGSGGSLFVFGTAEGSAAQDASVVYTSPDRPPFYLSWSPDSARVTFLTTEPNGIALRLAPSDASAEATVVREGAPLYWDWVDPARLMLHVGSTGPEAFVGDVDLGGTGLEQAPITSGLFRAPAVTTDGRLRAYVAAAADGAETVVVAARDGSSRHEIPVAGNVAFSFDPAGSQLAFTATDQPAAEPPALPIGPLRIADAVSGAVRTVLEGRVVAFFWSPDGRTIAALRIGANGPGVDEARSPVAPVIARLRGTVAGVVATDPSGIDLHLSFVDIAGGTGSERDVRVSNLFAFQLIPYFDQYALSHRLWSPDSRSIALPVADGDSPTRIVVIPADGSPPVRVAEGVSGFWSP